MAPRRKNTTPAEQATEDVAVKKGDAAKELLTPDAVVALRESAPTEGTAQDAVADSPAEIPTEAVADKEAEAPKKAARKPAVRKTPAAKKPAGTAKRKTPAKKAAEATPAQEEKEDAALQVTDVEAARAEETAAPKKRPGRRKKAEAEPAVEPEKAEAAAEPEKVGAAKAAAEPEKAEAEPAVEPEKAEAAEAAAEPEKAEAEPAVEPEKAEAAAEPEKAEAAAEPEKAEAAEAAAEPEKAEAAEPAVEPEATEEKQRDEPSAAIPETAETSSAETEEVAPVTMAEEVGGEPMGKLRVLMVGSECVPFAKTGGLADVLGTLPQELNKLDVDARVMLPFHSQAKVKYRMQTQHVTDFYIYMGWKSLFVGIDKLEMNGVTYYLIDNEEMYGGPIYKGGIKEGEQYAFFCRAVCEAMDRIDFLPQVVHCNDWQTGMIPLLLKSQYLHRPQSHASTVFSIHNLMYQGQYSFKQVKEWLGVEERFNTPEFIEHYGCVSFMKAGLVFADWISTVSPSYAQEIRNPYFSYSMEGILNARAHETTGILNGMNVDEFNPANDPKIPYHFDAAHPENKRRDKEELLKELGLYGDGDTPVIGMVGRLTHQKGLNLLMPVFEELMREDVAFIVLGTGDVEYENFFRGMEAIYRGRVCAYIGYSDDVAHRIYAGSDLFLMPSRFEPCGISQMIAMRYGTLPIVRETGGLKDTVVPYNEFTGEGNGFSFTNYDAHDMLNVIRHALYTIRDERKLTQLRQSAFAADYSFAKSAKLYRDMFWKLS